MAYEKDTGHPETSNSVEEAGNEQTSDLKRKYQIIKELNVNKGPAAERTTNPWPTWKVWLAEFLSAEAKEIAEFVKDPRSK